MLQKHEHTVCKSVSDHHIHELRFDCSDLHLQIELFSSIVFQKTAVIPQYFYTENILYKPKQANKLFISKKHSRGPPYHVI
ncbi:hypothetical protein [Tenacibaculum maritimum]|uniref:Uncharacterized protein n=1 Tax=Tenacibaculum maritimum NCIMB 2154 TaxID=1349785 RepID=A0A2H1EA26_9FLAO|nr:hypothetical protein [Tenacibaculum maritimum]SFZ82952.1 protein of unknown function [Tenacibaculum maritimum NCIMB 2154]